MQRERTLPLAPPLCPSDWAITSSHCLEARARDDRAPRASGRSATGLMFAPRRSARKPSRNRKPVHLCEELPGEVVLQQILQRTTIAKNSPFQFAAAQSKILAAEPF